MRCGARDLRPTSTVNIILYPPQLPKIDACGVLSVTNLVGSVARSVQLGSIQYFNIEWQRHESLNQSECCFCLVSVAKKVTSTPPVNKRSMLQSFGQAAGDTFHRPQTHDGDRSPRCVGHDVALVSRVRGDYQSTSLALLRVLEGTRQRTRTAQRARKFQTRIRTAPCAPILELQLETDKLEFLAECTKRARCEIISRTTPTDDV